MAGTATGEHPMHVCAALATNAALSMIHRQGCIEDFGTVNWDAELHSAGCSAIGHMLEMSQIVYSVQFRALQDPVQDT